MTMAEPQPAALKSQHRWLRLAPGRFLVGLLALEGLLWLSDRLGWPAWHKGYAVLTAVAVVGVALLLMVLWLGVALLFRRQFQFSIRSLLVLVAATAVPCSWLVTEMRTARKQHAAVLAIQGTGGAVRYEHELDTSGNEIPVDGLVWDAPCDEWQDPIPGESAPGAETRVPVWLRQLWGDDFFRTAVWASVGTDDGLKQIPSLNGLKRLTISPLQHRVVRHDPAVRKSLESAGLHDTRYFYFADNSPVTDTSLQPIEEVTQLEELDIQFPTQITNAGLEYLKRLKRLKNLRLFGIEVTAEEVKKLQQALPNCKIEKEPPIREGR
jgi:hypothetical protein